MLHCITKRACSHAALRLYVKSHQFHAEIQHAIIQHRVSYDLADGVHHELVSRSRHCLNFLLCGVVRDNIP